MLSRDPNGIVTKQILLDTSQKLKSCVSLYDCAISCPVCVTPETPHVSSTCYVKFVHVTLLVYCD